MNLVVGNIDVFAIELRITDDKWSNQTAIWIDRQRLGNWEDRNLLYPFLNSLKRLISDRDQLWLDELSDLICYQLYLAVHPFYNNSDKFFNLSEFEMKNLERYDKFLFSWGENFDSWGLTAIYEKENYKFLWVKDGNQKSTVSKNMIQCKEIPYKIFEDVYEGLKQQLPRTLWPVTF
jgi:hypothetical protein